MSSPESNKPAEYAIKKSDIKAIEVKSIFYYWYCPICNKMTGNYSKNKLMLAIKLHLIRAHGIKSVVFEE
jgi:hypothetical protein